MNLSPIPSTPSLPPNSNEPNTQILLIVLPILLVIFAVIICIVFDFFQESNTYQQVHRQQVHRQEVPELEMREIVGGVDPHLRDNIPNFVYQPGISGTVPFEERKCAWCQEEFTNGDRLSSIPSCGHVFHSDCIGEYMLRRNTCPFCRQPIALPAVQD